MSTVLQRNLSGGELSPSLRYRVGLNKYQSGAAKIKNAIIPRHGGIKNREGTKKVGNFHASAIGNAKLFRFEFSNDDALVLEFGDFYMRVIKNGSYVMDSSLEADITQIGDDGSNNTVLTLDSAINLDHPDAGVPVPWRAGVLSGFTAPNDFLNGRTVIVKETGSVTQIKPFGLDGKDYFTELKDPYTQTGINAKINFIYQLKLPYINFSYHKKGFIQSLDTVFVTPESITGSTVTPFKITRIQDDLWNIENILSAPNVTLDISGTDTTFYKGPDITTLGGGETITERGFGYETYAATFYDIVTGVETIVGNVGTRSGGAYATPENPITIDFGTNYMTGNPNVIINLYKSDGVGSGFGFIGSNENQQVTDKRYMKDIGVSPDYTKTPPILSEFLFKGNPTTITNTPSVAAIIKQRLFLGNFKDDAEAYSLSQIGRYDDFSIHRPILDSDAIVSKMAGRKFNEIRYAMDLKSPVIFTASAEWILNSDLSPMNLTAEAHSHYGCSRDVPPIEVGNSAIFLQARNTILRDLGYEFNVDGFTGNDLTIFANHLFDKHTIVSMDYQQVPDSIVWVVRNDGVLLSLTYIREQNILAWCQHDLGGFVIDVCCIPEGNKDAVYLTVEREINGKKIIGVEVMSDSPMDVKKSFSNTNGELYLDMSFNDNGNWSYMEEQKLVCAFPYFDSSMIGDEIHVSDGDDKIKFRIDYINGSGTEAYGYVNKDVSENFRNNPTVFWGYAKKEFSGLFDLEGESVSVIADGNLVASNLNDDYEDIVVTDGKITLDHAAVEVTVGLSFISDFESLAVDTPQGETFVDKKSIIRSVSLAVLETKGLWVGRQEPPVDDIKKGLTEVKSRVSGDRYDEETGLRAGIIDISIESNYVPDGHVFVRQIDPLPFNILAIGPNGDFPVRGG